MTYTGDKSSYAIIGTSSGYLRPLSEEQSSVNGLQYGQGFALLVDDSIDIRESDKAEIEGQIYEVRGVARHDRGAVPYKRCLVVKPIKP